MSSELWDLSLWSCPRPMWLGSGSRRKFYKQIVLTVQHGSSFAELCKNRHQNGPGIMICLTLTHSRHRMSLEFWSINSLLLTLCELCSWTHVLTITCSYSNHSATSYLWYLQSFFTLCICCHWHSRQLPDPFHSHGSDSPWE